MRHGFLLVNKPIGPTSHDIVFQVRKSLHEPKIGHLGTLDPLADGLLVLAVGAKALKVVDLFKGLPKEYIAEVTLGASSTTYDREGMITKTVLKPGVEIPVDSAPIGNLIRDRFLGRIRQTPPDFSAVKVGGKRAYALAREGKEVAMPEREVKIMVCDILEYQYPVLKLRIQCSSGTYIRSIANDIGNGLRCGGYLKSLTRTRVGPWSLSKAHPVNDIGWTSIVPLKDVLADVPRMDVNAENWEHIKNGRMIDGKTDDILIAWHDDLPVAILEKGKVAGKLKAKRVL